VAKFWKYLKYRKYRIYIENIMIFSIFWYFRKYHDIFQPCPLTPVAVVVCASKAWSICNAYKNLRGQHPKVRNVVCRKMSAWVGQYEQLNVFVCGPKFTIFSSIVEGVVADKVPLRFAIYHSVRGYSRSKSKVVRNRTKFCTFFRPPKF